MGSLEPTELVEAFTAMKDQLGEAAQQVSERLEIERRMRETPWVVLGVAAGAGFLLGGGLWPALRPIVRAAGRTMLSPPNLLAVVAALGAMRATSGGDREDVTAEGPVTPTEH